jgi:hypothetical protein
MIYFAGFIVWAQTNFDKVISETHIKKEDRQEKKKVQ